MRLSSPNSRAQPRNRLCMALEEPRRVSETTSVGHPWRNRTRTGDSRDFKLAYWNARKRSRFVRRGTWSPAIPAPGPVNTLSELMTAPSRSARPSGSRSPCGGAKLCHRLRCELVRVVHGRPPPAWRRALCADQPGPLAGPDR